MRRDTGREKGERSGEERDGEETLDCRDLLAATWLKAVLPLINDREDGVQSMAARLVEVRRREERERERKVMIHSHCRKD